MTKMRKEGQRGGKKDRREDINTERGRGWDIDREEKSRTKMRREGQGVGQNNEERRKG
jgi:hypothetical protein